MMLIKQGLLTNLSGECKRSPSPFAGHAAHQQSSLATTNETTNENIAFASIFSQLMSVLNLHV